MARETKHTPGPWYAERPNGSNGYHYVNNEDNKLGGIACCYATVADNLNDNESEVAANARLIASAPAMLEMLQEIADKFDKDQHLLNVSPTKIKELIKTIEG